MEINSPPNYAQAVANQDPSRTVQSPIMNPISGQPAAEKSMDRPMVVVVKSTDMGEEMQAQAINIAKQAVYSDQASPREMAGVIKREFDRLYQPSWHCVVGRSFGSFVTHEAGCFLFFYVDQWAILLFKTA